MQKSSSTICSNVFKHGYLPETILDLGSNITAEHFHEFATMLEIELQHNTLKHPQTVGLIERSHGYLKRIRKLNTTEQVSDWYKYVDLACYIHNTSYFSSIGCTPSLLFHG